MRFRTGEINIICSDGERTLLFYRDVLGFTFVEEEAGAFRLENDGVRFLILPFAFRPHAGQPYIEQAEYSFDLLVDDLAQVQTYFRERGVTFAVPWDGQAHSFVIRDPDGLPIEIIGR